MESISVCVSLACARGSEKFNSLNAFDATIPSRCYTEVCATKNGLYRRAELRVRINKNAYSIVCIASHFIRHY